MQFMEEMNFENKLFFESSYVALHFPKVSEEWKDYNNVSWSLEMNLCAWLEKHLGHSKSLVIKGWAE